MTYGLPVRSASIVDDMEQTIIFEKFPGEVDIFESEALAYIFDYGKPLEQKFIFMSDPHSVVWLDDTLGGWPNNLVVRLQVHDTGIRHWRMYGHSK